MSRADVYARTDNSPVCFPADILEDISDQMYKEGNPKYIWVDLIRDGYISNSDGISYHVYLYLHSTENGGNITIPREKQIAYIEKWKQFIISIKEPVSEHGTYSLHREGGIVCADLTNEQADFRKTTKRELYFLDLNNRGELRFLEAFLNDKLLPADVPLNLSFSNKGYYVNGKRMSAEHAEKYAAICLEEFGTDYKGRNEKMEKGPLPENTLGKQIAALKTAINATEQ
ncbi:hypothetical protein CAP35_01830 [Chitinophagaceae bacterium IBVUCB1]|nr:hypothetical protein CAP35_01830 [Chitinophagaceae bacterium IBVUCB1]